MNPAPDTQAQPQADAAATEKKPEEKEVKQEEMFAIGDDSDEWVVQKIIWKSKKFESLKLKFE